MANTVVTLTNTNIAIATADIGNTDVLVALAPANATNNVTLLSISSDYTDLITQIANSLASSAASANTSASASIPDYSSHLGSLSSLSELSDIDNKLATIAAGITTIATNSTRIATALEGLQTAVEALKVRGVTKTQGIYTNDVNDGLTGVQKRALAVTGLDAQDISDITKEINNPTSLPGDNA